MALIKRALLTWDKLETIAPYRGFKSSYGGATGKAMELIGAQRVPTSSEKAQVHELIQDLIDRDLPQTFTYLLNSYEDAYELWPQKLAPETWEMLLERGLVGKKMLDDDYPATQSGGLMLMATLADVLASDTRTRVTDRGLAYAALANAPMAAEGREDPADFELIVPLTFKTIALEHVSIERLIEFREREERPGNGHDYRRLRHSYVDRLSDHAKAVAGYPIGTADRTALDREFEQEMEDDLAELKDQLGVARTDTLLSKESLALIGLVSAGAAALSSGDTLAAIPMVITSATKVSGALASIGGPLLMAHKYSVARRRILRDHPMAYIYEADQHSRR